MKHLFKAPAFQLYAKEFLQDEAVIAMDLEAVGGYIILLCHQWNEGSVPVDVSLMARICRTTPERMQKIWPQIAPRFLALRGNKNRLVNPKLEIVRNEKMRFSRQQADSGERGAQKRWTNKPHDDNGLNGLAHASAIGSQWASDSSGSGSGSGSGIKPLCSSDDERLGVPLAEDDLSLGTDPQAFPPEVEAQQNNAAGKTENCRTTKPKAAHGGLTAEQEMWWAEFWAEYWLKRGKKEARKAFAKAVKTEAIFRQVIAAVRAQRPEMLQREPSKRPYAATWLNGERWEDELQPPAPSTGGVGYRDMDDWKRGIVQ